MIVNIILNKQLEKSMTIQSDDLNINARNKADYVYQILQNQIVTGRLAPDSVLSIREVSTQLGVSRTPVKEAISRLVFEHYAEMLPNHCAVVSKLSTTDVLELLELREALEYSTAYYAAQRRTESDIAELQYICEQHGLVDNDDVEKMNTWDREFHLALARATHNRQMSLAVQNLFSKMARIILPITGEMKKESVKKHQAILDQIIVGNADEARRLMLQHNRDIQSSTKAFQAKNIHLFTSINP